MHTNSIEGPIQDWLAVRQQETPREACSTLAKNLPVSTRSTITIICQRPEASIPEIQVHHCRHHHRHHDHQRVYKGGGRSAKKKDDLVAANGSINHRPSTMYDKTTFSDPQYDSTASTPGPRIPCLKRASQRRVMFRLHPTPAMKTSFYHQPLALDQRSAT